MWRRGDHDSPPQRYCHLKALTFFYHNHSAKLLSKSPTVKTGNESSKPGQWYLIYFEPKQEGPLHNCITGTFELHKHVSQISQIDTDFPIPSPGKMTKRYLCGIKALTLVGLCVTAYGFLGLSYAFVSFPWNLFCCWMPPLSVIISYWARSNDCEANR